MDCEVFLIRHGETAWNAEGRFQGGLDSLLTAKGRAQAGQVGRALGKLLQDTDRARMHVSPLGRTRQTADLIVSHFRGTVEVLVEPNLREVSVGSWDGLTDVDIDAGWPGLLNGATPSDWFFRSPDGESYATAARRARDWLAGLDGTVIAVSHGLLGRIIRGVYLNLPHKDALQLPVPQDVIWHLHHGKVDALQAESRSQDR